MSFLIFSRDRGVEDIALGDFYGKEHDVGAAEGFPEAVVDADIRMILGQKIRKCGVHFDLDREVGKAQRCRDDETQDNGALFNDDDGESSHGARRAVFPGNWTSIFRRFQLLPPSSVRNTSPRLPTAIPKPSLPNAMAFKLRRGI